MEGPCESCGSEDGPFTVDMVTGETICRDCAQAGANILG